MKGSYILLIELPEERQISVGKLGPFTFRRGFYAYAGSALNGLESRTARHLRRKKKLHWHIDYLLEEASIQEIAFSNSEERAECVFAQTLSREFDAVPGFGSSDCKCSSHLYYGSEREKLREGIIEAIEQSNVAHGIIQAV